MMGRRQFLTKFGAAGVLASTPAIASCPDAPTIEALRQLRRNTGISIDDWDTWLQGVPEDQIAKIALNASR